MRRRVSWTSRAGTRPRTRAGGFMRGRHAPRSEALLLALALGSTQCAGCAARPPVRHRIVINRFQYQPPVLEIHDMTVAYHQRPVLWDIDLTLDAPKLVGVIGPNGAGKSTLIKAVLGLLPLAGGKSLPIGTPFA